MFLTGVFLSVLTSSMTIVVPKLTQTLIDQVFNENGGTTEHLVPILTAMCVVTLIRLSLRYVMVMCFEYSSQNTLYTVRQRLFRVVLHQEMRFFDRYRTGDLMTRVTGDLEYVRHVLAQLCFVAIDSITVFIAGTIYLCTVDVVFTLILLCIVPLLLLIVVLFNRKVKPMFARVREQLSQLNTTAQENISGNRVVKAFANEEFEKQKFAEKNEAYRKANLDAAITWQKYFPFIQVLAQLFSVITVLVGGLFVIKGRLTFGGLAAFSGMTWALSNPMINIGNLLNDFQRFNAAADKVIEMYYAQPTVVDRAEAKDGEERLTGRVEFQDVSFAYDRHNVLEHISFTAEPGQTIAIMGTTGAGKTTLISLIARFYDVTEGSVLVDGVDVRLWKMSKLRSSIGMATQDVFLFSDTVDGNIAYGNPQMAEDDVRLFAKTADADGFIQRMEEGYDTIIGERGVGLSGGQRQRIALARALAVRPPILILDDTTSAVDLETEAYIQQQLKQLDFSCTKFLIAQRISSVRNADKIIVLTDGKMEIGTHDTLCRKPGYYREICELQDVLDLPELETQPEGGDGYGA